ncbi:MAG: YicC/YloC family endoribonuclease, partial [SAR324 cluster bacterium]|nr:YicC/YloC family endoribonuclease [SAR324 cluster bacterium]
MTGYGTAEIQAEGWRCLVEIRSVNQRFLDIRLKLPSGYQSQEK